VSAGALQVRGCLLPVQSLSDIPAAERGVVEDLASQLHIGIDAQSIDTAISLTDAYQSTSPVQINGVTLTPQHGAAIVIYLDNATIGPINAELGALSVQQLTLSYQRAGNEWRGQGKACVLAGVCLDMVAPNGRIIIRNGQLSSAGASLGFPTPGIELYPGVSRQRIGFGIGLNPTRFTGNARINVLRILTLDGRVVLAFPSARQPYLLDRNEVGGGFPASFYTRPFTTASMGIAADEFLEVPVLGDMKLGNGYFLYNYPGYLAFGGPSTTRSSA
jgi:hypothetical protein